MMSLQHNFRAALAAFLLLTPAVEAAESDQSPPLVTIRFNQPRVYFDQQLYSAISKAIAVKPEVTFD